MAKSNRISTVAASNAILGNMVDIARRHPLLAGIFLGSWWKARKQRKLEAKRRKGSKTNVIETTAFSYKKVSPIVNLAKGRGWFGDYAGHAAAARAGWQTRRSGGGRMKGGLLTGEVAGVGTRVVPPGLKGALAHAKFRAGGEASRAAYQAYASALGEQLEAHRRARWAEAIRRFGRRKMARPSTWAGARGLLGDKPKLGDSVDPETGYWSRNLTISMPLRTRIWQGVKSMASATAGLPRKTSRAIGNTLSETIRMAGPASKAAARAAIAGAAVGSGKAAQDRIRRVPGAAWLNVSVDPAKFLDTVDYAVSNAKRDELKLAGKFMFEAMDNLRDNDFIDTMYPEWREDVARQGLGFLTGEDRFVGEPELEYPYPGQRGARMGVPAIRGNKAAIMSYQRREMMDRLLGNVGAGEVELTPAESALGSSTSYRRAIAEREAKASREVQRKKTKAYEGELKRRKISPKIESLYTERAKSYEKLARFGQQVGREQKKIEEGRVSGKKLADTRRKIEQIQDAADKEIVHLEGIKFDIKQQSREERAGKIPGYRPPWASPTVPKGKTAKPSYRAPRGPEREVKMKGVRKPKKKKKRRGKKTKKAMSSDMQKVAPLVAAGIAGKWLLRRKALKYGLKAAGKVAGAAKRTVGLGRRAGGAVKRGYKYAAGSRVGRVAGRTLQAAEVAAPFAAYHAAGKAREQANRFETSAKRRERRIKNIARKTSQKLRAVNKPNYEGKEDYLGLGSAGRLGRGALKLAGRHPYISAAVGGAALMRARKKKADGETRQGLRPKYQKEYVRYEGSEGRAVHKSILSLPELLLDDTRPLPPLLYKQIASVPVEGLLTVREDLQGRKRRKKRKKKKEVENV